MFDASSDAVRPRFAKRPGCCIESPRATTHLTDDLAGRIGLRRAQKHWPSSRPPHLIQFSAGDCSDLAFAFAFGAGAIDFVPATRRGGVWPLLVHLPGS